MTELLVALKFVMPFKGPSALRYYFMHCEGLLLSSVIYLIQT